MGVASHAGVGHNPQQQRLRLNKFAAHAAILIPLKHNHFIFPKLGISAKLSLNCSNSSPLRFQALPKSSTAETKSRRYHLFKVLDATGFEGTLEKIIIGGRYLGMMMVVLILIVMLSGRNNPLLAALQIGGGVMRCGRASFAYSPSSAGEELLCSRCSCSQSPGHRTKEIEIKSKPKIFHITGSTINLFETIFSFGVLAPVMGLKLNRQYQEINALDLDFMGLKSLRQCQEIKALYLDMEIKRNESAMKVAREKLDMEIKRNESEVKVARVKLDIEIKRNESEVKIAREKLELMRERLKLQSK